MSRPAEQRRVKDNLMKTLEAKLAEVETHLAEIQARRAALFEMLGELRGR